MALDFREQGLHYFLNYQIMFKIEKSYTVPNIDLLSEFISILQVDKDICSEYKMSIRNGNTRLIPSSGSMVNYFYVEITFNESENLIRASFVLFPIVKILLVATLLVSPLSWVIISLFKMEVPINIKWLLIILPFVQIGVLYLGYITKTNWLNSIFKKIIKRIDKT